eukprot:IDg5585t1
MSPFPAASWVPHALFYAFFRSCAGRMFGCARTFPACVMRAAYDSSRAHITPSCKHLTPSAASRETVAAPYTSARAYARAVCTAPPSAVACRITPRLSA